MKHKAQPSSPRIIVFACIALVILFGLIGLGYGLRIGQEKRSTDSTGELPVRESNSALNETKQGSVGPQLQGAARVQDLAPGGPGSNLQQGTSVNSLLKGQEITQ